ncbi:dihydrodipicolinate synthase family protein [Candidatus Binatus sp.]|uniref:dihydrodipicolinate synthase family protein n=1 Tax=Candidatus Binatus sp. TaxID=2811406 RepID=UPI003BB00942
MKLAHGILAMLVTPFTDDYRLNEDALRREVQWAIAAGADGVVAAPSIASFCIWMKPSARESSKS